MIAAAVAGALAWAALGSHASQADAVDLARQASVIVDNGGHPGYLAAMRAANPAVVVTRYRSTVALRPDEWDAATPDVRACADRTEPPADTRREGKLLVTRPGYNASGSVLMDTTCAPWRTLVVDRAAGDVRAGYNAPYLDVQPHLVGGVLSCPSIWVAQGTTGPAAYPAGGGPAWAAQCAGRLSLRDAVSAATGHHVVVNAYVWAASASPPRGDRETVEGFGQGYTAAGWIGYLAGGPKDAWFKPEHGAAAETAWAEFAVGDDGDDLFAAGHQARPMPDLGAPVTPAGTLASIGVYARTFARGSSRFYANVNPTGHPITWTPGGRYRDVLTGALVGGGVPYTLAANSGTVVGAQ